MTHELFYTSLPAGLKPGTDGFCIAAETAGLSTALASRLKSLSGYQEVYPPGSPHEAYNPVAYCHWRLEPGDRAPSVLSRVCSAGMDYSRRTNLFAHHLVLDPASQPPGGPALVMSQPGILETRWTGEPRTIAHGRSIPGGNDPPAVCRHWAAITGDAGWAGVLAAAAGDTLKVAYIIFTPGQDMLPLIREAMALLPPKNRWRVCFSTYFVDLPAGMDCHWRCVVTGTEAAQKARRLATSGVVLDFTQPLGRAPDEPLVHTARTGEPPPPAAVLDLAPVPLSVPADELKPDRVTFNRGPRVALRPKSAAAAARAAFAPEAAAVAEEVPTFDDDPDAVPIPGTGGDDPAFHAAPPAKPNIWLWILAFVWPLLVIPGIVAWHVTAESQENQKLKAKNIAVQKDLDLAKATVNGQHGSLQEATTQKIGLEKELGATTRQAAELAEKLRIATSQATAAENNRDELVTDVNEKSTKITDLQASVDKLNRQLKGKEKGLAAAGRKTAAPAPPPFPPTPDAATGEIDPFTDQKVLASPIPEFDSIKLLNPLSDKHIAGKQETPAGGLPQLQLHYKDEPVDATTRPSPTGLLIGIVKADPQYGLVWISKFEGLPSVQDQMNAKTLLHECGVGLYCGEKLVGQFQFGISTGTFYLSKKPLPLVPSGSQLPENARIESTDVPNWLWSSEGDGTEIKFEMSEHRDVTFTVTLNLKENELSSDWGTRYKSITDALTAANNAVIQDNKMEGNLEKNAADAQSIKDNAKKATAIAKHTQDKSACDAILLIDTATLNAAKESKERYDSFTSCKIKVLNPGDRMVLKLVTVSK